MEVYSENGMLEAHEPNCFHESMYMVANTHSNTVNVNILPLLYKNVTV
jgi:hypothetical protein